jgi:hypothetical protein
MDRSKFDAMARSWGCDTRRNMVRIVAGTAIGAVILGRFGIDEASAGCVAPGEKCKSKHGKKKKCCGGAKCQGKRCQCPDESFACGKTCCAPGQLCQGEQQCVNGSLEAGDLCDPQAPLACETGNCQCISDGVMTQCTCRQETCFDFGVPCENTSQCCTGGCEGFTNTCLPIEP